MRRTHATIGGVAAVVAAAVTAFATATPPSPAGVEALTSVRVTTGVTRPTLVTHAPGDFTRLYIVEKPGAIRVFNLRTGVLSAASFLDINSLVGGGTTANDERGLLGLAFHPDFQTNRFFYVYYTNNSNDTVVARYTAFDGDQANAASAMTVLTIDQPFTNHNGGWIGFSPANGYLYIATGDGGAAGDPGDRAQDITNQLLGKMLRIDVDGATPYAIPPSNPFVGVTGDDEIWAYGLRNPWRCSFDREKSDLYIADVGQVSWEEINFQRNLVPGGRNYGWRCREGMHDYNFSGGCASQSLVEPFHEYSHSSGVSITGGYVYRGCAIPSLDGRYFFGDYGSARIWSLLSGGTAAGLTERTSELVPDIGSIGAIASFGEDARGEIYIADHGGEIFKIVPVTPTISEADFDCSGAVDFNDLLGLLANYGPCDGCLWDLDGDHEITFSDLLTLLAEWG